MSEQIARQFHDVYERLALQFGYETREDTKVFDPQSQNGRLMIAVCAEVIGEIERERNQLKTDLWAEKTEHRMTKTTLSSLAAERNQLRRALALIAEDCTAWLHSQIDEPSVEFIKAIRTYAHEQSQAPLDTANCQLPTANSPE